MTVVWDSSAPWSVCCLSFLTDSESITAVKLSELTLGRLIIANVNWGNKLTPELTGNVHAQHNRAKRFKLRVFTLSRRPECVKAFQG